MEAATPEPGPDTASPQAIRLTLAAGPVNSLYFPLAGALQRAAYNATLSAGPPLQALVAVSNGSQDNLEALLNGQADLALIRSDTLFVASQTGGEDSGQLRVLGAFALEHLTLITRREDGITTFQQMAAALADGELQGVGLFGPQARQSLELAWQVHGSPAAMAPSSWRALQWPRDAGALCRKEVGVVVLSIAHPNRSLGRIGARCELGLVAVAPSMATALASRHPYLIPTDIPGDFYGAPGAVSGFGLYVALAARPGLADSVAYDLTKVLSEALPQIQAQHPGLYNLDRDLVDPQRLERLLHPAARRYYEDAGRLPAAPASP